MDEKKLELGCDSIEISRHHDTIYLEVSEFNGHDSIIVDLSPKEARQLLQMLRKVIFGNEGKGS